VTDRPSQNDGFVTDALFFWSTVSEVSTVSTETYMYTKSVSCCVCVGTEDRGGIEEDDSENRVNKQAAHIIVAGQ